VDVVLECTGQVPRPGDDRRAPERGAKRVIVAAPVKFDSVLNVVVGVNHHLYDPARHPIVTAASCTTNCLAPVVKVVHEAIGHPPRPDHHHPRPDQHQCRGGRAAQGPAAARSAMLSLQPTTTGSATAIALIYPELKGKLNGHACARRC
jgi:glyceraldehyde 3-phosphate dehydrogenase